MCMLRQQSLEWGLGVMIKGGAVMRGTGDMHVESHNHFSGDLLI